MLVTSIFSFSSNVFYPSQNKFIFSSARSFLSDWSKILLCGKELFCILQFAIKDLFCRVLSKNSLLILQSDLMQHFLMFSSYFSVWETTFNEIINCLDSAGLTLYHTILTFKDPVKEAFWNHCWGEKEKMLVNSIFFPFSHNVFYPIIKTDHHLNYIWNVVCKCFQCGQAPNFVIW